MRELGLLLYVQVMEQRDPQFPHKTSKPHAFAPHRYYPPAIPARIPYS